MSNSGIKVTCVCSALCLIESLLQCCRQLQNHRQKVLSEQQQTISAPTKRRAPRAPSVTSDPEEQLPTQAQGYYAKHYD